jgi:hypothetical protein
MLPSVSPRVELARSALRAASSVTGVVAGNRGPSGVYVTQDGPARLEGVVVAAEHGGRYTVDLFLTAALVPLGPLGDQVNAKVRAAAQASGLEPRLGETRVTIVDLVEQGGAA